MSEHGLIAERDLALCEKFVQATAAREHENLDEIPNTDPLDLATACFSSEFIAIAILTSLLYTTRAAAHSWYPLECCSEYDCRPLDEDRGEFAIEQHDSWKLWDGRVIRKTSTQRSPDGKFHLCETTQRKPLCFFVPPGAV
jgi:hypothetical protein